MESHLPAQNPIGHFRQNSYILVKLLQAELHDEELWASLAVRMPPAVANKLCEAGL